MTRSTALRPLAAVIALACAGASQAGGIVAHENAAFVASSSAASDAVTGYWTAARMKAARPRVPSLTPRASLVTGEAAATASAQSAADTTPRLTQGHGPLASVRPGNEPLFDGATRARRPTIAATATVQDYGSAKAPYTTRHADIAYANIEKKFPWRTVGKLYFSHAGGDYECSAVVIQRRVILTAGHCVHEGSGGNSGWHDNFVFVPAFDGSAGTETAIAPWGRWTGGYAITTSAWLASNGVVPNAGDFALIEITDRAPPGSSVVRRIGEITGWLPTLTQSLKLNHTTKLGYPINFDSGLRLIESSSANYQYVFPNNVEYGSDMSSGSSGGPWIQNFAAATSDDGWGLKPGSNRVVGVTSYGYDSGSLRVQGASVLNADFTSMYSTMCAHQNRNCN